MRRRIIQSVRVRGGGTRNSAPHGGEGSGIPVTNAAHRFGHRPRTHGGPSGMVRSFDGTCFDKKLKRMQCINEVVRMIRTSNG